MLKGRRHWTERAPTCDIKSTVSNPDIARLKPRYRGSTEDEVSCACKETFLVVLISLVGKQRVLEAVK